MNLISFAKRVHHLMSENSDVFSNCSPNEACFDKQIKTCEALQNRYLELVMQSKQALIERDKELSILKHMLGRRACYVDWEGKGNVEILSKSGFELTKNTREFYRQLEKVEGVHIHIELSNRTILLQWEKVAHAKWYTILCEDQTISDQENQFHFFSMSFNKFCEVSGLESGKRYNFCIRAGNSFTEGPNSTVVSAIFP